MNRKLGNGLSDLQAIQDYEEMLDDQEIGWGEFLGRFVERFVRVPQGLDAVFVFWLRKDHQKRRPQLVRLNNPGLEIPMGLPPIQQIDGLVSDRLLVVQSPKSSVIWVRNEELVFAFDCTGTMRTPGNTTERMSGALSTASSMVYSGLLRRKWLEDMKRQATYDQLTGILRREAGIREIANRLKALEGTDRKLWITFIDLDNLKDANDGENHARGDALINHDVDLMVAAGFDKERDLVRWAGDEFALLSDDLTKVEGLLELSRSIPSFEYEGEQVATGMSAGAICVSWELVQITLKWLNRRDPPKMRVSDTVETFVKRADEAMYLAKAAGRSQGGNLLHIVE